MTDRYLPVEIAARRLGVCGETIRRWFRAGKLPGIRYPSGHYRISADAIEKILAQPSTDSTPPTSSAA